MRLVTIAFCALVNIGVVLAAANISCAAGSDSQTTDYATVRLISATAGTGQKTPLLAGLDIRLQPAWHLYWRMAGEGGVPPKFDWAGSANVKDVAVQWPVPQRFEQAGLYSFGYEGEALFPLQVTPVAAGKPVTLNLKGSLMVCKDICIPQPIALSLDIPQGEARPSKDGPSLEKALKALPHAGDMPGLKIDSAVIGPKALVVRAWSQSGYEKADLFAEVKDGTFFFVAPPVIQPDRKDPRGASLLLMPPDGAGNLADALMHHKVTLTLVKDGKAIEKAIDF